jgi:hypothetical protein
MWEFKQFKYIEGEGPGFLFLRREQQNSDVHNTSLPACIVRNGVGCRTIELINGTMGRQVVVGLSFLGPWDRIRGTNASCSVSELITHRVLKF